MDTGNLIILIVISDVLGKINLTKSKKNKAVTRAAAKADANFENPESFLRRLTFKEGVLIAKIT